MSGGVDSSVAAALLKKQGFDVVGVFFKPWAPFAEASDGQATFFGDSRSDFVSQSYCNWEQDRRDALSVASVLGIPFKTWDFSKEYKNSVGDYMIESYRRGLTPKPDVMCNKEIKFGLFLKKALTEGADYIATGHYVRKIGIQNTKLLKGKDKNKDQSYFLWTLTQEQLKRCLFPIGDYIKPEVRKLAKKFKLLTHNKKDSQGVCFIGQLDMAEFLKSYIKPKKGDIRLISTKEIIGKHESVAYYTIGQRHGLNIGNGKGPYFVVSKDIRKNIIYVGEEKDLYSDKAKIYKINWINGKPKLPVKIEVKIRYRTKTEKAVLYGNGELKFQNLVRAITPGQSMVFYKGEEMFGGGIINQKLLGS